MQCPHIIALTRQWSLRNPLLRMNRFERYRGLFSKRTKNNAFFTATIPQTRRLDSRERFAIMRYMA
jgi:hypothetical protein